MVYISCSIEKFDGSNTIVIAESIFKNCELAGLYPAQTSQFLNIGAISIV